jgi:hypothetical protein
LSCVILAACATAASPTATTNAAIQTAFVCPSTPAVLAPAETATVAFALDVTEGSQRYQCLPGGVFSSAIPDAQLFSRDSNPHQIIHHFGGPSWEALDSSSVVAAKTAGVTVDSGSIQWLLLDVTKHFGPKEVSVNEDAVGTLRPSTMAPITQIQRLATHGGLAPTTGCDADHVGQEFDSSYGAFYVFYVLAPDMDPAQRVRCGG